MDHSPAIETLHDLQLHHTRLLIGGSVIIVVELDEKEDLFTSIGQSTTEDLFPE